MDEQQTTDVKLSQWFSTYGLITVERTLGVIGFHLTQDELTQAIHDPHNIHHIILEVPFKNILNGIIFDQNNQLYRI